MAGRRLPHYLPELRRLHLRHYHRHWVDSVSFVSLSLLSADFSADIFLFSSPDTLHQFYWSYITKWTATGDSIPYTNFNDWLFYSNM